MKEQTLTIDVEDELRRALEELPTAQRRSVARRHVLEQEYSAIGRIYDRRQNAVRQSCSKGIRHLRTHLVRAVLGGDPDTVQFLVTFYKLSNAREPRLGGDLLAQAIAHAASVLLISSEDVRQRHAQVMKGIAAAARHLELHRRQVAWNVIVARYGCPAVESTAKLPDVEVQRTEFEAMETILSELPS